MKPSIHLPLFGILAVLLALTIFRYRSGENLKQESATLGEQSAGERPARNPRTRTDNVQLLAKPVNWAELDEGHGNMRDFAMFKKQLPLMSRDELVAQLDEITRLDFPASARLLPESMLLNELIQQDPESALRRFIDLARQEDSAYGQILPKAMALWARREPAQAVAWFDEQIATGMFPLDRPDGDGTSLERQRFEEVIVCVLLATDPESATKRLDAILERSRVPLPGEGVAFVSEREVYVRGVGAWVDIASQNAYANLVRRHLELDKQTEVIADPVQGLVTESDLWKVSEYLERIQANPIERAACAGAVVGARLYMIAPQRRVTLDDLNHIVSWTSDNAPEAVGSVTGQFLGLTSIQQGQMSFAEAAAIAVSYFDTTRNDAILVEFIKSSDSRSDLNRTSARIIANKIGDEEQRRTMMDFLQ